MGVAKPLTKLKKGKSKKKLDLDKFVLDKFNMDKLIKKANHKIDIEFLYTPLKSKPCKDCPALDKGICNCARKRLK